MTSPLRRLPHLALVASLAFGACTGSSVESGDGAAATTTTTTEAAVETTEPAATTTDAPEPSTNATPPESMPGDVIEFGPRAGDEVSVVGVAHDDTLNVRIAPGVEFDVIATLDPDASMIAGGENRLLTDSFWVEVDASGSTGWVNESFVGFLGVTREVDLGSVTVAPAASPEAFGLAVAETFASTDPVSKITLVAVSDTTVTYDVLGLGDDALKGLRLKIATTEIDEGFTVSGLEEQAICSRGITADLKCV